MPTLITLVSFSGVNANPIVVPFVDANGDLFGTTTGGGAYGDGTLFEIVNNGTLAAPNYAATPTILVSFNPTAPSPDGLIADAIGDLFGTTTGGSFNAGTVFEIVNTGTEINPQYAATPKILAIFNGSDGADPQAGLIEDANGDLLGTTVSGGAYGDGTVFELVNTGTVASPSYTPTVLFSFNGTDGADPYGGLIADSKGDLFGTTQQGGAGSSAGQFGNGTVFEIVNNGTAANPSYAATPTVLASFNTGGAYPQAKLTFDTNGDLFGTTADGGAYGDGTVFEIVNNGTAANPSYAATPTVLASFNGADGADPFAGLLADADGNLFGTTSIGGAAGYGTVFEIVNNGTVAAPSYASTPKVIASFTGTNGALPFDGLTADAAGDLFGSTTSGGANNDGTIFEVTSSGFVPFAASIAGTAQDGQTLTANTNFSAVDYQWQVLVGGNWLDIAGATAATFVVQQADIGWQIRVQAVGNEDISVPSAATNTVLDAAGNQYVYELTDHSTVGSGLFQYVYGTAANTTVNSGGEQNIYPGGTATGTTVNAGGVQVDWGTDVDTTLDGGTQYVWRTATGTTIASGGVQDIGSGGVASNVTIDLGGVQTVGGGASATDTMLGGTQNVFGSADGTTIGSGGLQNVHGSVTNTTINRGGDQNVYSDGVASGTTVSAGGVQVDWGSANNTTLDGGTQYVQSGVTANGTIIAAGGLQYVGSSGTADNSVIDRGGLEYVQNGGAANGVTFGGQSGTLVLEQASALSGSISDWQVGDSIDLRNVVFGSGTTLGFTENSAGTGGTLTVSDGTNVATLALLGQYAGTDFALSSDGNGGTDILREPTLTTLVGLSSHSNAGLIADAYGDLFGTTYEGGANNDGTVFEIKNDGTLIDPNYAGTPITLASFNGANGQGSDAALITDANGNLFGTTIFGGSSNDGTVFEIKNNGTISAPNYADTPTTLISFSGTDGQYLYFGLIADGNGDLFGTTADGGASNDGTVFEIKNSGTVAAPIYAGTPTTIISFAGDNGRYPSAGLVADANGDLFGTASGNGNTQQGGPGSEGTVFEIKNNGTVATPNYAGTPTTLVDFGVLNGGNNYLGYGAYPYGSLVADASGDLFGITQEGGKYGYGLVLGAGTVFEIKNNGTVATPNYASMPTTLFMFDGSDGEAPNSLIVDANGDLFGTTEQGGTNNDGTLFEIQNSGTVSAPNYSGGLITLVNFNGSNGLDPNADSLVADGNGDLFGTAGTVFEITNSGYVVPDPVTIADGASFEIGAASEDAVTFAGPTGTLQLDQSQSFVGTVAGFGGADQIDLRDIAFGANTTLGYAPNNGNTIGALTVSDGTHTATLALLGQYSAAAFALSSDGHGGTLLTDPATVSQAQTLLAPSHA